MTILDNVNTLIATQKSELTGLFTSLVTKACPNAACGKLCPTCGKVHPEDQLGNQAKGDTQSNQSSNSPSNTSPTTGGNNLSQNPTNDAQPQIINASSMVQSMGSALKHPVQVNHDAAGVGVTHAVMTVHPEWNHEAVKSKIDSHLKTQNWKSGKGSSGAAGSKTYESPEGHKIHVAPVGKHLIVSAEDKKGTAPTPYTAPQKPVKKSDGTREDSIIGVFEEGIARAVATVQGDLLLNDSSASN